MKMLLPLAVLVAVPAHAQDAKVFHASETWPVHVSGRACTLVQAMPAAGSTLSVSYDGAEVILTSTNELEEPLPSSGEVDLKIVFLDNGDLDFDDGWGSREFTYDADAGQYRFSTRFAGEKNVRQILSDLAGSKTIGLLQGSDVVVDYALAGIAGSIARLRDCAARTVAAN